MTAQTQLPIDELAICYTCFNSMRTLRRSLAAACSLSKRIVAVDSGSTDGTLELLGEHSVEVHHRDWTTTVEQKTFAMGHCAQSKWTLLLDSDETVNDDLAQAIRAAISTATDEDSGFEFNRQTWFAGKPLRHTFQPEWRLRLVRSAVAHVRGDHAGGHDRFELERGRTSRIAGTLRHDSWASAGDMLARGVRYGVRYAEAGNSGGKAINVLINPAAGFFKQLVLRRGFLDGWRGWVVAGGVASQTLAKHVAIMAARAEQRERR